MNLNPPPQPNKPRREGPGILQVLMYGSTIALTFVLLWRMLPEDVKAEVKQFFSELTEPDPQAIAADEMAEHVEALIDLGRVPGWWDTSRRLDAPSN